MSKNYYVEEAGEYQLHIQQWCDGGTWVTKNGKTMSVSALFRELQRLQAELEAARAAQAEAAKSGFVIGCEYSGDGFCSDADKRWFDDHHAKSFKGGEV